MARPSTLPRPWLDLAEAVGGIPALQAALGWPYMVLYRRARGIVKMPKADRVLVDQLAKQHGVSSPFVWDLGELELFGQAISKGFPASPDEITRLKTVYPEDRLVQIAETDGMNEDVLRGASTLLGL